jgi:xylose isomerase
MLMLNSKTNAGARFRIEGIEHNAYLAFHFLDTLAFQNGVATEHQELAEVVDLVSFPVLDTGLKFVNGGKAIFSANGFFGAVHHRLGRCVPFHEVLMKFIFISSMLHKFL